MPSSSLVFYGVSLDQLNAALKSLNLSPLKAEEGALVATGELSGDTPVGKLACDIALHLGSRQLTVEIKDKPALLTVDSIRHHIENALRVSVGACPSAEPEQDD